MKYKIVETYKEKVLCGGSITTTAGKRKNAYSIIEQNNRILLTSHSKRWLQWVVREVLCRVKNDTPSATVSDGEKLDTPVTVNGENLLRVQ